MQDDPNKPKPPLPGQAKTAFNQAVQGKVPEKTIETPGRDSVMVKQSQPVLVPKPPGSTRQTVDRQKSQHDLAKDAAAAKSVQPTVSGNLRKPVIELEHLKEGAKLREKFRAAARKEQERDR